MNMANKMAVSDGGRSVWPPYIVCEERAFTCSRSILHLPASARSAEVGQGGGRNTVYIFALLDRLCATVGHGLTAYCRFTGINISFYGYK